HAHGVDDDVIHRDVLELHRGQDAVNVAPDEEIDPGRRLEARRDLMPKIARIECATLKVKHAVVLRNEVQVASAARYPDKLGNDAVGVRYGMKAMAAHREIEAAISSLKLENALVLECQPGCEVRVP